MPNWRDFEKLSQNNGRTKRSPLFTELINNMGGEWCLGGGGVDTLDPEAFF